MVSSAVNSLNSLWVPALAGASHQTTAPHDSPVFHSLRSACKIFDQKLHIQPSISAYEAWTAVVKFRSEGGYSHPEHVQVESAAVKRGEVVSTVLNCLDLPSGSNCKLQGSEIISKLCPDVFSIGEAPELINEEAVSQSVYKNFDADADPNVSPGSRSLNELAALLLLSNVCRISTKHESIATADVGVRVFSVSKGDFEQGAIGPRSQRFFWDCRKISACCWTPPSPSMGSISALASLETGGGTPMISEVASTDIACFFYSLSDVLPGLCSLLYLEGASPECVKYILLQWLVRSERGEFGRIGGARDPAVSPADARMN